MDATATAAKVPCCPPSTACPTCDILPVVYRVPYPVTVPWGDGEVTVPCEVTYRFSWKRCRTGMGMGDVAHSVSLVPGETVHLQVSDSQSRFSYDSESQISTFQATSSHESAYASQFADRVSSMASVFNGFDSSSHHEDSVSGGGSAGLDLGFFSIGGSAGGSSYNSHSADAFGRYASAYARESSLQVQTAVRSRASVSIGHVATREHAQGESQNHWESSSRTLMNPNRYRSVSYLFYQVVTCSTVTWSLDAVDRTVQDPLSPVGGLRRPVGPVTGLAVKPERVSTLNTKLVDTTRLAGEARDVRTGGNGGVGIAEQLHPAVGFAAADGQEPIPPDLVKAALAQLDAELAAVGLIDGQTGKVSAQAQADMGWEHDVTIPVNGFVIKSCLDECHAAEPEALELYQLEIQRAMLENQLLAKQIELLAQSQEYRCCPCGEDEPEPDPGT